MGRDIPVLIAGAGIAGLSVALALAQQSFPVELYERADRLDPVGAGLQLSPNATRLLDRLGVLERLRPVTVAPRAIVLRNAATLREIASVPLGAFAEARWGAPYLTTHRADLQAALVSAVADQPLIRFESGVSVGEIAFGASDVIAMRERKGVTSANRGSLLVAADGVWSPLRQNALAGSAANFTGSIAWRATIDAGSVDAGLIPSDAVSAFLHPGVHLIAYPIRAGKAVNLVAFTPGIEAGRDWDIDAGPAPLHQAFRRTAGLFRGATREMDRHPGRGADRRRRARDDAFCRARRRHGDRGRLRACSGNSRNAGEFCRGACAL